jgi:transposase
MSFIGYKTQQMAGKIKSMSQVKQLLLLHQQGSKIKYIARSLGISKNTVKSYLARLHGLSQSITDLLDMPDPALERLFTSGNPAYKDERYLYIRERLEYYATELKRRGVTQKLLWEEYIADVPDGYGLTQFRFHLRQQLIARKPSMVLQHKPADKLFIDFAGHKLSYVDSLSGECIECPVFIASLPFSDYCFAIVVRTQSIEDFIYALRCCLEHLGGIPFIIVPDNLKAAIIKANNYEPTLSRALEDFANHYGFTVVPARVAHPKDKALVENQVKLLYNRVYAKIRNQQFFDLTSLNEAVKEKVRLHNQTRMQKKPFCREEQFLSLEKPQLQPLPEQTYEVKYYRELKVAQNNHVYLSIDRHYYSVPFKWIGQRVKIIYTRSLVRIYMQGEQIAIHPRSYEAGKYSTILDHLCSHHQHYLSRSPSYYMNRAQKISPELHFMIQSLFDYGRPAEQNYRTCDGFFRLHRRTTADIFTAACRQAIEDKCYGYQYLMRLIEHFQKAGLTAHAEDIPLPTHQNIRGKDYYQQLSLNI